MLENTMVLNNYRYLLNDINEQETKILKLGDCSSDTFFMELSNLIDMRKKLYDSFVDVPITNKTKYSLFSEHQAFCTFIFMILKNKKMSKRTFMTIVYRFLYCYSFIKDIDSGKRAYMAELKTINDLKLQILSASSNGHFDNRMYGIKKITEKFIEKYGDEKQSPST